MAELSVEEAQRLARLFLTGLASELDVQRLQAALPEDQTLALELLAQIQTALDDVAPEGLSKEQAQSVAARIEALVAPRVRRRGLSGLFKRMFRRRRPSTPAEARVARRGAPRPGSGEPPATPPEPTAAMDGAGGLEDMAPIAPVADAPTVGTGDAPAVPAQRRGVASAKTRWRLLPALGLLLLLAGAWILWRRRPVGPPPPVPLTSKPAARPAPRPAASPAPWVAPTPLGPPLPRRAVAMGPGGNGPLPAALPPTTPQAGSQHP